jgi:hypothetical protein
MPVLLINFVNTYLQQIYETNCNVTFRITDSCDTSANVSTAEIPTIALSSGLLNDSVPTAATE